MLRPQKQYFVSATRDPCKLALGDRGWRIDSLTPMPLSGKRAAPSDGGLRDNRSMPPVHPRITIESDKRDGKPCIRGMRITVNDVLGWLAHGMTEEEILEEHPGLEKEDFAAVYGFASDVADAAYGGR